jgi:threonine aldolase
MRSFASDNNSGVHPLIMEALAQANADHAVGYGDDPWTREAVAKIREAFTPECDAYFVFNGTGSNVVALQSITRPYNSILCADTAHIFVDECGSPVKMTGCQLVAIPTPDGKLTPDLIRPYLVGFNDQHHSQPGAIYLSECSELGTIYTPDELRAITTLAHNNGLKVHVDGARLSNACAALHVSLKALTVDTGIDVLSFGGTKNGLMLGECVIVFDSEARRNAMYFRKQSAQLASKLRFLSCQFTAYLDKGLWLTNAQHANAMAEKLHEALNLFSCVRFTQKVESNQLFLSMPRPVIEALRKDYFFYTWNEANNEIRLVTSFDTREEEIDELVAKMDDILAHRE